MMCEIFVILFPLLTYVVVKFITILFSFFSFPWTTCVYCEKCGTTEPFAPTLWSIWIIDEYCRFDPSCLFEPIDNWLLPFTLYDWNDWWILDDCATTCPYIENSKSVNVLIYSIGTWIFFFNNCEVYWFTLGYNFCSIYYRWWLVVCFLPHNGMCVCIFVFVYFEW